MSYLMYLAQAYGAGNYNDGVYNGSTSSSSSSSLVNTGTLVAIFIGVAVLIILLSIAIKFWRKPKNGVTTSASKSDKKPRE